MKNDDDLYKIVEAKLYSYPRIKAEIEDIKLDIEKLENEYKGISSISYEEKTSTTNKISSSIEIEIINKQREINYLEALKRNKEIEVSKIDNMLSILNENEYTIIKLRYFNRLQFKRVADKLYMNETYLFTLRKKIITEKLIPFVKR